MPSVGRQSLGTFGNRLKLLATGDGGDFKIAGVTIDWTTVAAVSGADVTLTDGVVVVIGNKYLNVGQVITKITSGGKFGPYDPAASDGRQTLTKGKCYVLNQAILLNDIRSDHPQVLEGGKVWYDRLIVEDVTGTHTLADGPTYAEFIAVFPGITFQR